MFFILKRRKMDLGFCFVSGLRNGQLKVIFRRKCFFGESLNLSCPQQVFFRVSNKLLAYAR